MSSVYDDNPTLLNAARDEVRRENRRFLIRAVVGVVVAFALAVGGFSVALADNYLCESDAGCLALMPQTGGKPTRRIMFKKGDWIDTSSGWIVNPADGWRQYAEAYAGLLPHGW